MSGKTWIDLLPVPDPEMMKRLYFTEITALPENTTWETAVGFLHNHAQMIELNPLIIRFDRTTAPKNATPDEVEYMTWYEMTDEIQYLPGTSVRSEVTYKGGFHDLPRGLQTHVFAPGGVDIQAKWSVGGSMPGEPREAMELGLNKPVTGLYLREDVDLRCNVFLANFVKRNLKKSHAVLVERLIKKVSSAQEATAQPGPIRNLHLEGSVSGRRSMQDLSPTSAYTDSPSVSSASSPIQPRRSGTHCTCPGPKHLIACPYYSRLYQPPQLKPLLPMSCPTLQPKSTTGVSPAQSWTETPSDLAQSANSASAVLIQQRYAEYGTAAAAATPDQEGYPPSEVLPEVAPMHWTSDSDFHATHSYAPATESRTAQPDSLTNSDFNTRLEYDPESVKQYYQYLAERKESQ